MSPLEGPPDSRKEPAKNEQGPLRVPPEVQEAIEKEPVSERVKRKRLAGAFLNEWEKRNAGQGPDVEILGEGGERAA